MQVIKTKGTAALVSEASKIGKARVIPSGLVIPWYEGLLLLEELESQSGRSTAVLWHRDRSVLEGLQKEKQKRVLSAELYGKQHLMHYACTAPKYVDSDGKLHRYRRPLRADAPEHLPEGVDREGLFRVSEIVEYLPPWEAFCHPKCGIYQDFYLVRWGGLNGVKDYAACETGCDEALGQTWEPDECLPTYLDALRLNAKRRWLRVQKAKEDKVNAELMRERAKDQDNDPFAADDGPPASDEDELGVLAGPAQKRQRGDEEPDVAIPLFDSVDNALSLVNFAKTPGNVPDMRWQVGSGRLPKQICRVVDCSIREKRVGVAWAIVRQLLGSGNEGVASPRTRLAAETACELAKAKKVKLRAMEDTITAFVTQAAKAGGGAATEALEGLSGVVSWVFVHMFPHGREAGWGWSHPGWTWVAWWDFVARCLQGFKPSMAYGTMRASLELMVAQEPKGTQLYEIATWNADVKRLQELRRRLMKMSGMTLDKLLKDLDHVGLEKVQAPPEAPPIPQDMLFEG